MIFFSLHSSPIEKLIQDLKDSQVGLLIVTHSNLFAESSCFTIPLNRAEFIFANGISDAMYVPWTQPDKKLIPDPTATLNC